MVIQKAYQVTNKKMLSVINYNCIEHKLYQLLYVYFIIHSNPQVYI